MSQLPEYPVFKPMPGRRATLECGDSSPLSNRTSLCGCKEQIQTSTPSPQKPSGKALPHSRRAGLASLAPRPGCTRWRIPPIEQINLQIPAPVLNFLRCKKSKTVPGAGTLPVGGTGGRSAPGRRRQPPVRTRIRVGRCRIRRHRPAAEPECAAL